MAALPTASLKTSPSQAGSQQAAAAQAARVPELAPRQLFTLTRARKCSQLAENLFKRQPRSVCCLKAARTPTWNIPRKPHPAKERSTIFFEPITATGRPGLVCNGDERSRFLHKLGTFEQLELFEKLLHFLLWIRFHSQTCWKVLRLFDPKFEVHISFFQLVCDAEQFLLTGGLQHHLRLRSAVRQEGQ